MLAVEFSNVCKKFGNFSANENISFGIKKNSVHCVLGENGAGKSTLMKILFGMHIPDSGSIKIFDEEVKFSSPHDAIAKKIGMVHQHFMLIDDFTVAENVILGNELTKGIEIDFKSVNKTLGELIKKYNLNIDPHRKISRLSISEQQKVEILKLLYRESEILIFDEPTAVLSPVEVAEFFNVIEEFRANGKTIILITHKLNEVKQISDKVSILRRGKLVHEEENVNNSMDIRTLSSAITGNATLSETMEKAGVQENNVIVEMTDIKLKRENVKILNGLNLTLMSGEIYGLCGVEGNGQNEIIDIIAGFENNYEGGYKNESENISLVPDDRIRKGMISEYTIGENIFLKNGKTNFISQSTLENISKEIIKNYDVRVSDTNSNLGSLSGGNQQKVIIARELEPGNELLIFSHPTRGVDINATLFIHSKIIEERNKGKSILLISSDLDELAGLSDRLGVLYNGKIVKTIDSQELKNGFLKAGDITSNDALNVPLYEQIGKLMIGITN